jgi:hypothetical protein
MNNMSMKVNGLYLQNRQPNEVIGGCIEIFENVWSNPLETINLVEELCHDYNSGIKWERAGTIGSGAYQNMRTNQLIGLTYTADITGNPIIQNIHNAFYTAVLATTNSYAMRYNMHESLYHEGYNLLKYSPGEEYKAHYDGGTDIGRAISAICYLNDDYEGGEIEFTNFKVKIKPPAGSLILFPSNYAYTHVAHPIESGVKYAIVTWVKDRNI